MKQTLTTILDGVTTKPRQGISTVLDKSNHQTCNENY